MTTGHENSSMLMQCGSRARAAIRSGDLREVLAALAAAIVRDGSERDLLVTFERELQRTLSIRTIRLREIPARYHARLVTPTRTIDSIVLGVPSGDPRVQAVLEASCEPNRPLEERDQEVLGAAAHLGALVLEAVRVRARGRVCPSDGAAPLIGSSSVMQALRSRVERVAVTDFTVLIEGGIDR